ncbi:cadherin-like beta sandwich domain-containing protein, partial [Klebsiella pneumoniae]|nr:cadherin-like beta sandwich domain-containing protein [Klebsiella pneumoniae]
NEIPIVVTNKDGDVTTYTVTVTRTEKFRSANLKSLKLTSGTLSPTFNKGVYQYTTIVENTVSSVGVTPVAEDANATIEVNGKEIPSGATSPY